MTFPSKPALLFLVGAVIDVAPSFALAQHACESQRPACPEGQTYDTTSQTCIQPLNS